MSTDDDLDILDYEISNIHDSLRSIVLNLHSIATTNSDGSESTYKLQQRIKGIENEIKSLNDKLTSSEPIELLSLKNNQQHIRDELKRINDVVYREHQKIFHTLYCLDRKLSRIIGLNSLIESLPEEDENDEIEQKEED